MRRHVAQMQERRHRCLGLLLAGAGHFEDKALRRLAPIAKAEGIQLCLLLEDVKRNRSTHWRRCWQSSRRSSVTLTCASE